MTPLGVVERAVKQNMPALLWGAPGIGKTSQVKQLADRLSMPVETVLASIRQPDDFGGLPHITDEGVVLVPPAWGRRLCSGEPAILFLDEISCTTPAVQSALLRVVFERVVGDLELPDTVRIVAAANPPELATGGWDLGAALANRLVHIQWPCPTVAEWAAWAAQHLPLGGGTTVVAFLHRRPELLLQVPSNDVDRGRAWASPRSWAMAASMLGQDEVSDADVFDLARGCVGDGPALELSEWRALAGVLPDPRALLAGQESWTPPKGRIDVVYAVAFSVVSAAISDLGPSTWWAAWGVLDQCRQVAADATLSAAAILAGAWGNLTPELRSVLTPPAWFADALALVAELRA
jgi:hypothetical protein